MARSIANVNILTDTTQSFIDRFNSLAFSYSTEAITANSTMGVTGSVGSPVNARLIGTFGANTINAAAFRLDGGQFAANSVGVFHGTFAANSSTVSLGQAQVIANNSAGAVGQVLSSGGPGAPARWTTISGVGTVTSITAGNGLVNTTITSTGVISVQAADASLVVTSSGVQVNALYITALTSNANTLLGRTWSAPAAIGVTTANTATFTTATANSFVLVGGYVANSTGVFHSVPVELATGTNTALRVKANTANIASIQFTNSLGSTVYSTLSVTSTGVFDYGGGIKATGLGVGTDPVSNEIRATGNITSYFSSDIRLKTNIKVIENALDKVQNIRGCSFTWTDDVLRSRGGEDGYFVRSNDVGVIAQEIEQVLPEAVSERADGTKAVRYELLIPLLIEAIKELADRTK